MKVSCNVIMDLLPLVKDNVASEESKKIVLDHLQGCEACHQAYKEDLFQPDRPINDDRILSKIRKKLFLIMVLLSLLGISIGLIFNKGLSENIMLTVIGLVTVFIVGGLIIKHQKEGDHSMRKFFVGRAIGTLILFSILGLYLIARFVINLF